MRYTMRRRSCGSVRIFSLDRDALRESLHEAVGRIAKEHGEVTRVVLFGSVATGMAGPGSDADILIVVQESADRFIDRSLSYKPYFTDMGVGVDVFVYTESERTGHSIPLLETALKNGETLFSRN